MPPEPLLLPLTRHHPATRSPSSLTRATGNCNCRRRPPSFGAGSGSGPAAAALPGGLRVRRDGLVVGVRILEAPWYLLFHLLLHFFRFLCFLLHRGHQHHYLLFFVFLLFFLLCLFLVCMCVCMCALFIRVFVYEHTRCLLIITHPQPPSRLPRQPKLHAINERSRREENI